MSAIFHFPHTSTSHIPSFHNFLITSRLHPSPFQKKKKINRHLTAPHTYIWAIEGGAPPKSGIFFRALLSPHPASEPHLSFSSSSRRSVGRRRRIRNEHNFCAQVRKRGGESYCEGVVGQGGLRRYSTPPLSTTIVEYSAALRKEDSRERLYITIEKTLWLFCWIPCWEKQAIFIFY